MEKQQQDENEMLMRLVKLNNNFAKMKEQKKLNKKKKITMTITMKTIIFLVKINNFTSLLLWKLLLITKKFFV